MVKFEIDKKGDQLVCTGDLVTVTVQVMRMVQMLHSTLLRQNPGAAARFKALVRAAVFDDDSPVFAPADIPGINITIVTERK